jgi:hypothetical protein
MSVICRATPADYTIEQAQDLIRRAMNGDPEAIKILESVPKPDDALDVFTTHPSRPSSEATS